MPITQSRLNTILTAAEHLESIYLTMARTLAAIIDRDRAGIPESTFNDLTRIAYSPELTIAPQREILILERERWRQTVRRNQSEARRKQRHRANAGDPNWANQPITMQEHPRPNPPAQAPLPIDREAQFANNPEAWLAPSVPRRASAGSDPGYETLISDGGPDFIPPGESEPIPQGVVVVKMASGTWIFDPGGAAPADTMDEDGLDAAIRSGAGAGAGQDP